MLGDVVRRADRRIRNLERARVRLLRHLHAPFDLADRIEIVGDNDAVTDAEAGLKPRGLSLDAVEDAAGLVENRRALLAEHLVATASKPRPERPAWLGGSSKAKA